MAKLIEPLLPLQQLDLQIHTRKVLRAQKPVALAPLREKLERTRANLAAIREEIKSLKLEGARREGEVKEIEAKIQKLTVQSNTAKKNDEYQVFLKEISGLKADKSRIEDGLLDAYMQVDEKAKLEKVRGEEVEVVDREHEAARKQVDAEVATIDRELEQLLDSRRESSRGVESEVLRVYERILSVKEDGLALAALESQNIHEESGKVLRFYCQGCSVDVTAQDVNLVLLGRDIVRCRACSRILHVAKGE